MATNSIFELNGKAYDALTGAMLGSADRVQHTARVQHMPAQPAPHLRAKQSAGSMDGMVSARPARAPSKPHHVSAHQPQPTKTLMRHAVKAPAPGQFHQPKQHQGMAIQVKGALKPQTGTSTRHTVAAKLSSDAIDPRRAHRAQSVSRSHAVKHFTPAPDFRRPAAATLASTPVPIARTALRATHVNRAQPAAGPHHEDAYEQDLFAQALAHATGHEEKLPDGFKAGKSKASRRKRGQILGIVGSLAVFLIMVAATAYQNKADIELHLASAKAGFSASVPLWKPDGYALDKLAYGPGNVAAVYQDPARKSFTVTQKKSNWDSQTLLENFVATTNEDYKGFQSNGRTVYVYGDGNATWVNAGIWYQIKDTGSLSSEQLVRIAASI